MRHSIGHLEQRRWPIRCRPRTPTPNPDAVLAEIDRLAQALPCPQHKLRLAGLRAQVAQLVREARAR
jgi:hypothetical protein